MKLHYYKCTNPENLPPYEEYDFAKGLVGYKKKLSKKITEENKLKYLGKGTEQDVYVPLKRSPGRIVKTAYNGTGSRF